MTQPIPRQPVPYRFAAMAILCTWCKARPGQLCTNQRGTTDRRKDVHTTRAVDWIQVLNTPCPERICQAPAGQPCTLRPNVHQARTLAAALPTTTP